MAYLINASEIRSPHEITETNNSMVAQNRTLDGQINRDYFGANKRTWVLTYNNVMPSDYTTIKSMHTTYLATNTPVTFEVTEANYTVAVVSCHINLDERGFRTKGSDYISNFRVILTEV